MRYFALGAATLGFSLFSGNAAQAIRVSTATSVHGSSCGLSLSIIPSRGAFRLGLSYDVLIRFSNLTATDIKLYATPLLRNPQLIDSIGNSMTFQKSAPINNDLNNFDPFMEPTNQAAFSTANVPAKANLDVHFDLNQHYTELAPGVYTFQATATVVTLHLDRPPVGIVMKPCELADHVGEIVVEAAP